MRFPCVLPWIALSLVALPRLAGARDTTVAVLGLEAQAGADPVASSLTYALRQRAAGSRGLAMVPGKDLIEVKLVFNCVDETAHCMSQAGKSLGADKMLYGSVRKLAPGYAVSLKWFDVASGRIDKQVSESFLDNQASPAVLTGMARTWFGALSGVATLGTLRLVVADSGAEVSVDGKVVAQSRGQPITVPDLPPGDHTVRVQKNGFHKLTTKVQVRSGDPTTLELRLEAEPVSGPSPEPEGDGSGWRTGFYVTAAGSVVTLAATIGLGLKVKSLEDQKRDQIRQSLLDANPTNDITATGDACTQAKARNSTVAKTCDDGAQFATLTNVTLGVGIVLAATSAYLFYKGFLSDEGKMTDRRSRIRLVPELDPVGRRGGLSAAIRF